MVFLFSLHFLSTFMPSHQHWFRCKHCLAASFMMSFVERWWVTYWILAHSCLEEDMELVKQNKHSCHWSSFTPTHCLACGSWTVSPWFHSRWAVLAVVCINRRRMCDWCSMLTTVIPRSLLFWIRKQATTALVECLFYVSVPGNLFCSTFSFHLHEKHCQVLERCSGSIQTDHIFLQLLSPFEVLEDSRSFERKGVWFPAMFVIQILVLHTFGLLWNR